MPEHGSTALPSELIELGEGIRDLLARSDALGLSYVAIHLCNALETLEAGASGTDGSLAAASDG